MKKYFYLFVLLTVILLAIINQRTPFMTNKSGAWSIGYGSSYANLEELDVLKNNKVFSFINLKDIDSNTVFLADPFFIKEKDSFYIFFEHQKTNSHAEIALLSSKDGIDYHYKGTILREKFHLSYPHVFKYNDEFYMLPETKRANAILLYKAYNFPYDWKLEDTLVKNVKLKDPSIFLSDTLNIMVASDDNLNMYMYTSNALFDNWSLYKTPIIKQGTEARCAGRFFVDDRKRLLLPIQNTTRGYGYGVSFYHFDFNNDDLNLNRIYPLFLKGNDTIPFFDFGMHHIDIQKFGDKMYYVFDGNKKLQSKNINLKGPLKWNVIDFLDWFKRL